MVHLLFEDGEDSLPSQLLKTYEKENSDVLIHFCGSNTIVKKRLKDVYTIGDYYLVYFDLIPDNPMTRAYYNKLINSCINRGYTNLAVIPIVGIEYYILKAHSPELNVNPLLDIFKFSNDSISSLERYYKYMLNNYIKDCMHPNVPTNTCQSKGLFYFVNCLCPYAESGCIVQTLSQKASLVINELPVFKEIMIHYKGQRSVNLEELSLKFIKEYNILVNFYKLKYRSSIEVSDMLLDLKMNTYIHFN